MPSSLCHCLAALSCRCRTAAIGCHCRTVFASPGPLPSPLGIAVPCARLAIPLCHPAVSIMSSLSCAVRMLCVVGVHSLAQCLGRGPVNGVVERALLGPLRVACVAVVVAVRRCRWFVVSRDRCRALVHNAWALQPSGGWLRGLALAPPDCGGGCTPLWVLVVVARMVRLLVTGAVLLCAVPGLWARCTMVVGVLVVPSHWWAWWWWHGIVAVGGGSARGWALGDWHRVLVHNAWAFGPGGWWSWGVLVVSSNCCHSRAPSRSLVGGHA